MRPKTSFSQSYSIVARSLLNPHQALTFKDCPYQIRKLSIKPDLAFPRPPNTTKFPYRAKQAVISFLLSACVADCGGAGIRPKQPPSQGFRLCFPRAMSCAHPLCELRTMPPYPGFAFTPLGRGGTRSGRLREAAHWTRSASPLQLSGWAALGRGPGQVNGRRGGECRCLSYLSIPTPSVPCAGDGAALHSQL